MLNRVVLIGLIYIFSLPQVAMAAAIVRDNPFEEEFDTDVLVEEIELENQENSENVELEELDHEAVKIHYSSVNAEFGYLVTAGNSESQSINAGLDVLKISNLWQNTLLFNAYKTSEQKVTSSERYALEGKTAYSLSDHNFFFLFGLYEDDRFSGYKYQVTTAGGVGRRLLKTDKVSFDLEMGPGFRRSMLLEPNPLTNEQSETEAIITIGSLYKLWVSENTQFRQELSFDLGEEATISKLGVSVLFQVNGHIRFKLSYKVRHTSEVPIGVEKSDTQSSIGIVYSR